MKKMQSKQLPIGPFYLTGSKDPKRKFNNIVYRAYRYLMYKRAVNNLVKELKEDGYVAHVTDPEYTSPEGDPVYIVWLKETDYRDMIKKQQKWRKSLPKE